MPDFAPHDLTANYSHPPFTASASSAISSTFDGFAAFDGGIGLNQYWVGTGAGVDWLRLDLGGGSATLTSYQVQLTSVAGAEIAAPKNWTMEGSNDGITWDVLDTVTNETAWSLSETRTYTCDTATTAYRSFRINITANNGDPTYTVIGELFLIASDYVAGRTGWTAYATNSHDAGFLPANAIDEDLSTAWAAGEVPDPRYPPDFWVDMGTARQINYITFTPRNVGGQHVFDVEIYLSSDGTNWGSPVAWGRFPDAYVTSAVAFTAQTAQWVKVHILSGGTISSCVDFNAAYDLSRVGVLSVQIESPLPEGKIDSPYRASMRMTGGVTPYTIAVQSGALPDGIAVDDTGLISGVPTVGGTFTATLRVTDSVGVYLDTAISLFVLHPGEPTEGATVTSVRMIAWASFVPAESYTGLTAAYFAPDDSGILTGYPGTFYTLIEPPVNRSEFPATSVKAQIAFLNFPLPVVDLSIVAFWLGIEGTAGGDGLNELKFYGCYLQADYSDGSRAYAAPSAITFTNGDSGPVTNVALGIDGSLDTYALIQRSHFSSLGDPPMIRIDGFGAFTSTPVPAQPSFKNFAY